MASSPDRLYGWIVRRWRTRRLVTRRDWAAFLIPWALVLAGLAFAFVAATPELRIADTVRHDGELLPNVTLDIPVDVGGYTYGRVAFAEVPPCAILLFVLDAEAAEAYRNTQALPDPTESLNCLSQEGVYTAIALLVLQNPSNGTHPYAVRAEFFLVTHPSAVLIFPGLGLFLAGGIAAIVGMLRGGLTRLVDELMERETYRPPIEEESPRSREGGRPGR